MKKLFVLFLTAACLTAAAESLPDLDWKVEDGKLVNWKGPAEPAPEGTGAVLKAGNATVFNQRKFLLDGKAKKVRLKFSAQGCMGFVGLLFYEKGGGTHLGSLSERIPNSDEMREYEAEFEVPEQMKNKPVGFFRVFFQNRNSLRLGGISASLEE